MKRELAAIMAFATIAADPAHADPFTMQKGQGRVIVTGIVTSSDKGFDDGGHVSNIPDYDQAQVYAQAQYGATDDLTILLTPSFRDVQVDGSQGTSGLGYTDVGARYRFAHGTNWTLSAQGLVRIPGKKRADRAAQVGSTDAEYDLRVGGGYSAGPVFASLEGSYRLRAGDPQNEFHADATLGYRATPRVLLLASSYNTYSDGVGRDVFAQRYRYNDVFLSGVYDVSDRLSLQAGYTATVAGRNALRQRGPLLGLWYRF